METFFKILMWIIITPYVIGIVIGFFVLIWETMNAPVLSEHEPDE